MKTDLDCFDRKLAIEMHFKYLTREQQVNLIRDLVWLLKGEETEHG